MDNKSKPLQLFGTPLSKSLNNEPQASSSGPINRRRARLEKQQIVQDEHGRRRFHGAFTGGFSAGYYGTVDTVQGFRPKSFTSHRGKKKHDSGSIPFEHRPEDYMDDEDFDEFGIAPKKVRLAGKFSDSSYTLLERKIQHPRTTRSSLVVTESIGEKILRCMAGRRKAKDGLVDQPIGQKTGFHGLGYKPLIEARFSIRDKNNTRENPLIVSLNHGRRLKISGEAFGEGVLDDDDDYLYDSNEYGYDNIDNYEFPNSKTVTNQNTIKSTKYSIHPDRSFCHSSDDHHLLDGFVLGGDLDTEISCDSELLRYPTPIIEEGWQMPSISEPIECHRYESESNRQNLSLYYRQSESFNEKFTKGTSKSMKCDNEIESRAGLVSYTHLKAIEAQAKTSNELVQDLGIINISIDNRRVIEWRPCSLLCKHFEVHNPYPDNAYCGSKPADLVFSDKLTDKPSAINMETRNERLATIELRRSIFNISFDETNSSYEDRSGNSEDEPQVIEYDFQAKPMNSELKDQCRHERADNNNSILSYKQKESDQESDIVLVDVPKPEPEVIVLSSSSSMSGCSTPASGDGNKEADDDDIYGPPLPPSREILKDLDRCSSKLHRSTSQFSSKSSNKQPEKRKKSKSKKHKSSKSGHRDV